MEIRYFMPITRDRPPQDCRAPSPVGRQQAPEARAFGLLWHEAFTGFVMTFARPQRLHLLGQLLDRDTNSHAPHTSNDLSVLLGVHRAEG